MDSQVLTAGSLFLSHLCPPNLSDLSNVSEPPKFSPQQLLERQYDDEGWNWLIVNETEHSQHLLDSAIEKWPSSPIVYQRRALYDIYRNNFSNAFKTYIKGIDLARNYDLYNGFLSFLYHKASVHEYILYIIKAVDQVGLDHRSGPLWRELATIYLKIYNTSLLSSGVVQGLIPNLFFSESTISNAPLIPSQVEQTVFKGLAPPELCGSEEQKPYINVFSDPQFLRSLFHKWLGTPTLNMAKVWEAYCTFERFVGGTSTEFPGSKTIADYEALYSRSSATYDRLVDYYSKIALNDADENLHNWLEVIEFEKSNPVGLDMPLCNDRVSYTYQYALNYMPKSAQLWYDLFQYNLQFGRGDEAVKNIQIALEKILPNHTHLSLALAIYFEKKSNGFADLNIAQDKLEDYFSANASILDLLGINTGEKHNKMNALGSDVPLQVIQLLNFIRRWKGSEVWRSLSEKIMNASGVFSWHLAWYMSTIEIQCYGNLARGLHILNIAQDLLTFDIQYTLQHFYLLVFHGKLDDARTLATKCLTGDKSKDSNDNLRTKLWLAWLNMEFYYGTTETLKFVEDAFTRYKLGQTTAQILTQDNTITLQVLGGLPWNHFTECVEWAPMPLKLFSGLDNTDDITHGKYDFNNLPVIVRPDVSLMSLLDVKSVSTLETKSLLHSSQRPPFPPSLSMLDSVVTPPKPIFDLLCLLPTPESIISSYKSKRGLGNPMSATDTSYLTSVENIDYLLSMIVSTDFNMPVGMEYTPLPLGHLIKVKDESVNNINVEESKGENDEKAMQVIRRMKNGGGIGALLDFLQNNT